MLSSRKELVNVFEEGQLYGAGIAD